MIKNMMNIDFNIYHKVLLADENCKDTRIQDVCKNVSLEDKIAIIIGPEGGISDKERIELLSKGVTPISLGELIFPTEAACLYCLSYFSLKKSENF
jgi:16S rRNA (uracil1498-N3)-methyltransferase